jgi:hypothetical protein
MWDPRSYQNRAQTRAYVWTVSVYKFTKQLNNHCETCFLRIPKLFKCFFIHSFRADFEILPTLLLTFPPLFSAVNSTDVANGGLQAILTNAVSLNGLLRILLSLKEPLAAAVTEVEVATL